jgi:predicted ArsR family transcriptional regulator
VHAVRKHILEILKEQNSGATVAELAEHLEMAPVSVRHHLDILQGDNLIYVDRLERKGNVGRPQQIYALTEEATAYFPNNFAALAGKLVEQIKQMLPPEQVPCAFRAMAQEMAAECEGLHEGMAVEERLEHITAFLTARGYLARWEEVVTDLPAVTDGGTPKNGCTGEFLLHKYNCPYVGVSSEHRELCLMDQTLINELTGCSCERVASLAEGSSCCTYRVASRRTGLTLDLSALDAKPVERRTGERRSTGSELVLQAALGHRSTTLEEREINGVATIIKRG